MCLAVGPVLVEYFCVEIFGVYEACPTPDLVQDVSAWKVRYVRCCCCLIESAHCIDVFDFNGVKLVAMEYFVHNKPIVLTLDFRDVFFG